MLGLGLGEAHVIRDAGGVVDDSVIASPVVSQRLLGTTEIVLIHHRDYGMLTFSGDDFKAQLEQGTGIRPSFEFESAGDLDAGIRQALARIQASPFLTHKNARGFVFDVTTGRLHQVS